MILVDTNPAEDVVAATLASRHDVPTRRKRLDVGDVHVEGGATTFVIERKRWSDLAASICDGRFHEQKARMKNKEEDADAPVVQWVYVIEGALAGWQGSHRGMAHKCMWAAVVKTALRDGVPVMHTASAEDTASLCAYLHEMDGARRATVVGVGTYKRKRDNLREPGHVLRAMLVNVPGISVAKADYVLAAYPTVAALCAASAAELAAVGCGGRALGPKMAQALKAVFA